MTHGHAAKVPVLIEDLERRHEFEGETGMGIGLMLVVRRAAYGSSAVDAGGKLSALDHKG